MSIQSETQNSFGFMIDFRPGLYDFHEIIKAIKFQEFQLTKLSYLFSYPIHNNIGFQELKFD